MNKPTPEIIAEIRTGKAKMEREGNTWTDDEKNKLLMKYFAGIDITTIAYEHQRTENAIMQQLIANNAVKNNTKPRSTYHSKKGCQCYRCSKKGTAECRYCMECEVNDNV